jgi:hypothetical protein
MSSHIALFRDLAARVGTASDEHSYGDNTSVWLENGRKVLDYIQSDNRFTAESFKDSGKNGVSSWMRIHLFHCLPKCRPYLHSGESPWENTEICCFTSTTAE